MAIKTRWGKVLIEKGEIDRFMNIFIRKMFVVDPHGRVALQRLEELLQMWCKDKDTMVNGDMVDLYLQRGLKWFLRDEGKPVDLVIDGDFTGYVGISEKPATPLRKDRQT